MKKFFVIAAVAFVTACGNPGGISDEDYQTYKEFSAPKILYRCEDRVGYAAGVGGMMTYNKLLQDAKENCFNPKEFEILESEK